MCLLLVLIPACHAFSSPATEYVITATPWCDNSVRLQVRPAVPAAEPYPYPYPYPYP